MFTTISHESLATTRGGKLDKAERAEVIENTAKGAVWGTGLGAFFGGVAAVGIKNARRPGAIFGYTTLASAAIFAAVAGWNSYDWVRGGW